MDPVQPTKPADASGASAAGSMAANRAVALRFSMVFLQCVREVVETVKEDEVDERNAFFPK
jgi:hypothetical protein